MKIREVIQTFFIKYIEVYEEPLIVTGKELTVTR